MFNFFRRRRRRRTSDDQGQGQGIGGGTKPGSGPSGTCVCPKCGYQTRHHVSQRCMDFPCPKCGTTMIRK